MKDILDLNYPSSKSFSRIPSPEILSHSRILLAITDFRDRLRYYNDNVCSLSYYLGSQGLHSCGEYDDHHGLGEIIYKKGEHPYTDIEFEIYLQERQKEIDRLKKIVQNEVTYRDKLKSFMEQKAGQLRFESLSVLSNDYLVFLVNGAGTVPHNLLGNNDVISLKPRTPEETEIHNLYLREYVKQSIEKPFKFHGLLRREYEGFLWGPALNRFKEQLTRALNKEKTITTELRRIETTYHYDELLDYNKMLYRFYDRDPNYWRSSLFNAFVNGATFDYSRNMLSEDDLEQIIHVEQVFEYYKTVMELNNSNHVQVPEIEIIFSDPSYLNLCLKLLKEHGAINNNGKCILSERKGYILFAIIEGLKTSNSDLLERTYTDDELISIFNKYLGTTFIQLKRNSKGFQQKLAEVRESIKILLKK